jgi:hypothetical protein
MRLTWLMIMLEGITRRGRGRRFGLMKWVCERCY